MDVWYAGLVRNIDRHKISECFDKLSMSVLRQAQDERGINVQALDLNCSFIGESQGPAATCSVRYDADRRDSLAAHSLLGQENAHGFWQQNSTTWR